MAYVIRHSPFGVTAGMATGAASCEGEEYGVYQDGSPSGKCCPDTDWSEATYRRIKGDSNTQHYLENRIHAVMWMLAPAELANAAWDAGFQQDISVSPTLVNRAARAVQNFEDIFPADRWVKVPEVYETDCGKYSEWRVGAHPRPDVRDAASKRVLGNNYTQAQMDAFAQKCYNVIWTVPRSQTITYAQDPPTRQDLLVVQGTELKPTPWLQSFLDTFAPAVASSGTLQMMAYTTVKKPSFSKIALQRTRDAQFKTLAKQQAIATEGGVSTSNTAYYVLGGAVAIAIGVGLWIKFKG